MAFDPFTNITSSDLAEFFRTSVEERVVIALPSIHEVLAEAVVDVAGRLKGRVAPSRSCSRRQLKVRKGSSPECPGPTLRFQALPERLATAPPWSMVQGRLGNSRPISHMVPLCCFLHEGQEHSLRAAVRHPKEFRQ